MSCSLPGSSVQGISQATLLEWVATPFSVGSSWPRDQTHISCVSCIAGRFFLHWAIREVHFLKAWWLKSIKFYFLIFWNLDVLEGAASLVSGKKPLCGLQMATISLCIHMAERKSMLSAVSPYKGTNPFNPNYLAKASSSNIITLGVRTSIYEFCRNMHQPMTS